MGGGRIDAESETFIPFDLAQITSKANRSRADAKQPAPTLSKNSDMHVAHSLRADGFDASEDGTGRGTPLVPVAIGFYGNDSGNDATEGLCPTLRAMPGGGGNHPAVAFQESQTGCREYNSAGTLRSNGPGHDPVGTRVREGMAVRRLTPRECERLQGFPDDYTAIPGAADGPRYKALGNSMAVPVMAWIGRRLKEYL